MAKSKKKGWIAWSEDEVKLLKRLFPLGRAREVAKQTGRALTAVKQKAYFMGIKTRERRLWTANEIKLFKQLYPTENNQSIADKLGRSSAAVKQKAYLTGLKKVGVAHVWSRQEEALLRKMYPDDSIRDIANQLGCTVKMVNYKVHKLGLRKAKPVWSKKELNLLRKLYPSRTAQQIADHIGRPVLGTRMRIHRLGLKKKEESHRTIDGRKQKRCSKCKKWKDESEFNKNRSSKDGFCVYCKKCLYYARKRSSENSKPLKRYLRYEERHRVIGGVKQKRCNRCKRWKAESGFYKERRHKDGLSEWCKECANKASNKARKKRLHP
jgi:hypothetical protein